MQTQRASWKREGRWDRAWRIRSQQGGVGLVVSGDLEKERLLRVSIASASSSASASARRSGLWVVGCGLWVVGCGLLGWGN